MKLLTTNFMEIAFYVRVENMFWQRLDLNKFGSNLIQFNPFKLITRKWNYWSCATTKMEKWCETNIFLVHIERFAQRKECKSGFLNYCNPQAFGLQNETDMLCRNCYNLSFFGKISLNLSKFTSKFNFISFWMSLRQKYVCRRLWLCQIFCICN